MKLKQSKIRILTVVMLIVMLLNTAILAIPTSAVGQSGLTFSSDAIYSIENDFTHNPNTFEAVICLPKGYSERAGVILGNYGKGPSISFEITAGAHPKLYINDSQTLDPSKDNHELVFENVNVATGQKLHLAIVRDTSKQELRCYVNGLLNQTIKCTYTAPLQAKSMALGADFRGANTPYFKGTIYSAAMFSDARTDEEIHEDSVKILSSSDGLIALYDLTYITNANRISDLSSNGYDMVRSVKKGMEFSHSEKYTMAQTLTIVPHTFEATLLLTQDDLLEYDAQGKNTEHRGGVILGTWDGSNGLNFETVQEGKLRIYAKCGDYASGILFSSVSVATGQKTHVAITIDIDNSVANCYINGSDEPTQTVELTSDFINAYNGITSQGLTFSLGGDYRDGNIHYFKGQLMNVAMFSDIRTADEIKNDKASMPTGNDTELIAWYDTVYEKTPSRISDASGNGYHMDSSEIPDERALGISFHSAAKYSSQKAITENPNTFEAWVYFPADMTGRGGVVFGSFNKPNCVNFEIGDGGSPRLYFNENNNFLFSDASVYTGKPMHVAIVRDVANSKIHCYVNGEEIGEGLSCTYAADIDVSNIILGGDYRSGNEQYFKGNLISAAMFSDVRDADTIKLDMSGVPDDDALIAYYDMTSSEDINPIEDKSGNGYHMNNPYSWISDKDPVTDYAYSFAVIGDTQIDALKAKDDFHKIYDYILDNIESKNIRFVMGLGDITDTYGINDASTTEWELASEQIKRMNGKVPYSVVRGNHDEAAEFNQYFPYNEYSSVISGSYKGDMLNTYQKFSVGGIKYLVFALDYGIPDGVIEWAEEIISDNPDYNVIITTHAYLFRDGTTIDDGDVCPPTLDYSPPYDSADSSTYRNNGDDVWEELVKKHENIVLVISGHDPCDEIIVAQDEGENGNIVTQLLIDPQGIDAEIAPTGMVAMLYFSADGRKVSVEWYSTIHEKYYKSENQFEITINVIESDTQLDYAELGESIMAAGSKVEADYTVESWAAMQSALTAARIAFGTDDQTAIDEANAALEAAVAALVDKSTLSPDNEENGGGTSGGGSDNSTENGGNSDHSQATPPTENSGNSDNSQADTSTDSNFDANETETQAIEKNTEEQSGENASGCASAIGGVTAIACTLLAFGAGLTFKNKEN